MAKKDRMKNGLDMLFENNTHDSSQGSNENEITSLRISLIEPDKNQPRTTFDEEKLNELSANIKEHGVLQPILVRPIGNGSYRIVAGERRWRASRMAGLTEMPVIVRELDDAQAAQISLIENLQREDLDPIEEAKAYQRLMTEYSMTQEQLSLSVGKSRSKIANSVRLLDLPEDIQESLSEGRITVGHAKVLCKLKDYIHIFYYCTLAEAGVSVRELERMIEENPTVNDPDPEKVDPNNVVFGRYDPDKGKSIFDEEPKPKKQRTASVFDPFKKYAVEAQESFDELGYKAKISKERDGSFSVKFSFDKVEELKRMIEKISQDL